MASEEREVRIQRIEMMGWFPPRRKRLRVRRAESGLWEALVPYPADATICAVIVQSTWADALADGLYVLADWHGRPAPRRLWG